MLTLQVHPRGLSPAMGRPVTFQGLGQFIALEPEEDPLGPIPKPPLEPITAGVTRFPAGGILAGIGILTLAALGVYLYMGRQ